MTLVLIVVISLIVWPFRTAYYWSAMDMEFQSQQISKGWAFLGYSMDIFFLLDVAFNFNCGFVRQHDYVGLHARI